MYYWYLQFQITESYRSPPQNHHISKCIQSKSLEEYVEKRIKDIESNLRTIVGTIIDNIRSISPQKRVQKVDVENFTSLFKWQFGKQLYKVHAFNTGIPINYLVQLSEEADILDYLQVLLQKGKPHVWNSKKFESDLDNEIKAVNYLLFDISCSTDRLLVNGSIIFISDVIENSECWSSVKSVDILALDKVIIDVDIDKSKQGVSLRIISPSWEIVRPPNREKRKILLTGEDGMSYNTAANDGINIVQPYGMQGMPGKSGGAGGNFVGIGNSFINDQYLKIDISGGNGGNGQAGGKGDENKLNN